MDEKAGVQVLRLRMGGMGRLQQRRRTISIQALPCPCIRRAAHAPAPVNQANSQPPAAPTPADAHLVHDHKQARLAKAAGRTRGRNGWRQHAAAAQAAHAAEAGHACGGAQRVEQWWANGSRSRL